MKYVVEVEGQPVEVEVTDGPDGPRVAVAGGAAQPARLAGAPAPLYSLELGARRVALVAEPDPLEAGQLLVQLDGRPPLKVRAQDARARAAGRGAAGGKKGPRTLKSPMPGVIVEVRVEVGVAVEGGSVLLVLEAMKMQNELRAEGPAKVAHVHVKKGQSVAAGAKLLDLHPHG